MLDREVARTRLDSATITLSYLLRVRKALGLT